MPLIIGVGKSLGAYREWRHLIEQGYGLVKARQVGILVKEVYK